MVARPPQLCTLLEVSSGEFRDIEATISRVVNLKATLTKYPVERGVKVSDHRQPENQQLQLECFWSNAPVISREELPANVDQRASDAYAFLKKCHSSESFLTVFTPFETFENMAIVSLTIPFTTETGDGLQASVSLEQVTIADSRSVRVVTRFPNGQPKQNKGGKTSKEVTPPEPYKSRARALKEKGAQLVDSLADSLSPR